MRQLSSNRFDQVKALSNPTSTKVADIMGGETVGATLACMHILEAGEQVDTDSDLHHGVYALRVADHLEMHDYRLGVLFLDVCRGSPAKFIALMFCYHFGIPVVDKEKIQNAIQQEIAANDGWETYFNLRNLLRVAEMEMAGFDPEALDQVMEESDKPQRKSLWDRLKAGVRSLFSK